MDKCVICHVSLSADQWGFCSALCEELRSAGTEPRFDYEPEDVDA